MMLEPAIITVHTKFRRDRAPNDVLRRDRFKLTKQCADIMFSLRFAPGVASVEIDFVQPTTRRFLYPEPGM